MIEVFKKWGGALILAASSVGFEVVGKSGCATAAAIVLIVIVGSEYLDR